MRVDRKRISVAVITGLLGVFVAGALRRRRTRTLEQNWPTNFAHRGASARAPENTLEAFRAAVEAGAGGLELDVHMTLDREIVVIHDATVDRTTNGSGAVAEMTLDELRSFDAGYRFCLDGGRTYPYRGRGLRVPTLAEIYEDFPDVSVNMEIKEGQPGVEERVAEVIRGAEERTLVAASHHAVVGRFRKVSGGRISTGASRLEIGAFYLLSRLRIEWLARPAYDALQGADALALVRKELWAGATFYGSSAQTDTVKVPRAYVERLTDAVCYAA